MYKNKNNGIDKKDNKKSFSSFISVNLDYKNNKILTVINNIKIIAIFFISIYLYYKDNDFFLLSNLTYVFI